MRSPLSGAGCIPVFVQKDPDCPSSLKQFNVVLRTENNRSCSFRGSNARPLDLQSNALPTELNEHYHVL